MDYVKPEILAPAGSMEALKAAVYAGADAVYLGGDRFGARAYAGNFNEEALIKAIEYSHLYGVKVYLTINTLFRNDEVQELFDYLNPFYQAGLDAVIVQDLGVMCYVHANFPDLPIHASTQMTITTKYAYSLIRDYGVTRIVPARELSIEEIAELKQVQDIPEIEVFVQGALCYCYSGQCLMSSVLGGRSGNRGRCAQTCRLPYSVFDEKGKRVKNSGLHVLSPKDLCGLEAVPDLIRAGVDSFKIEGRMKKPEYVAVCVRAYRRIVDAWFEGNYSQGLIDYYKNEMAEVFNRGGFTKGYYYQKNGKDMMSVKNPGNTGVFIGRVTDIRKNQILVKLEREVFKGDIFVLEGGKDKITLTNNTDAGKGSVITLNAPRIREITVNQSVMRMLKAPMMKELEPYIREDRSIPLKGKIQLKSGFPAELTLSVVLAEREYSIVQTGDIVQKADEKPVSKEVVFDKVGKTGNTRYYFEKLTMDISEDAFYPLKALKNLRRNGIELLEENVISAERRKKAVRRDMKFDPEKRKICQVISVMVSGTEQFSVVKKYRQITDIYLDLQYLQKEAIIEIAGANKDKRIFLVLPPVLRSNSLQEMQEMLRLWRKEHLSLAGVVVRNLDEFAYLKQIGYDGEMVIDYSLYTMNDYAAYFIRRYYPDARITVSVELNSKQLKTLSFIGNNSEMEVYGYQQLMISAQCLQNTLKKCSHSNPVFQMKDRYNKSFFVSSICKYCYNLIYNGVPTVLFDLARKDFGDNIAWRFHFTREDKEEVQEVLDAFFDNKSLECDKTRGHYNRGVE